MIKILSVDDNPFKQETYRDTCLSVGIESAWISEAKSAAEARRALAETHYDIMILDLVLPNRTENPPVEDGGIDLLKEINENPHLKMPSNIIIISEYEDALKKTGELTKDYYFITIKYEDDSEEWQSRLQSYLLQIIRASRKTPEYDYYMAVVCALQDPELKEVLRLPLNWRTENELGDCSNYFVGEYRGKKIICASSYEMGMSATAVLSTKMVHKYHPRYLVMTGIAAGINQEKMNYGDIMIADPCFDYGNGKWVSDQVNTVFKPSYRQIRLDTKLKKYLEAIKEDGTALYTIKQSCSYAKPDTDLKMHIGPLASGAAVVADERLKEQVLQHERNLKGFDMEAYALMLAGELSGDPPTTSIVIKSVSDFGNIGKNDDYQKYAAFTSAQTLYLLLKKLDETEAG